MRKGILGKFPTDRYPPDVDAYLAGVFDGEGWIAFTMRTRKGDWVPRIRVGVVNTVSAPIDLFEKFYGGNLWRQKLPSGKTAYRWSCDGMVAHWALSRMLPWLLVKRAKAAAALGALLCLPSRRGVRLSRRQRGILAKAYWRFHHKKVAVPRYPGGTAK